MNALRDSIPFEGPYLFAPNWGNQTRKLWSVVAATQDGSLLATLDQLLVDPIETEQESARVQFSLSLLRDVIKSGGTAWVRDSRLYVSWPDWSSAEGRRLAQSALSSARELRPLTGTEIDRVRPLFAPELDGEQLAVILA